MQAIRGLEALRISDAGARLAVVAVSLVTLAVGSVLYAGLGVLYLPILLGGIILMLMTLRSPAAGLSLVIAALYFPITVGNVTFLQLAGVLVSLLSLVWYGVSKRGFVFPRMIFPIVAFGLLFLYSLTFTRSLPATQYSLRKVVFNLIFCLLLVNVIDHFDKLRRALWLFVAMGVFNSVVGGYQFVTSTIPDYRAKGLIGNENGLGEVAALAFAVPLYHFLFARKRSEQVTALAFCAILAVGIVTSISRGAIFAFLCGLTYILFREKRYRLRLVLFGVLAVCCYPFFPDYFHKRFENVGDQVRGTVVLSARMGLTSRGYYNKAGIKIWKAHPVLGVGVGNYGFYYIESEFNPGMRGSKDLPPHNVYIQALAETGTIGFLVLGWWILQAAFNYWAAEKKTEATPEDRVYVRVAETLTLMTLVLSFFSGNLLYTHMAMMITLSAVCWRCAGVHARPAPGVAV